MTTYLESLKTHFDQQANPANAIPMKKYMREQFEFLGIKTPERKALFKQFITVHGLPNRSELDIILRSLWQWDAREYQYIAISFLDRLQKQLTPAIIPTIESLITTKSWWDTVDSLASHTVGDLYRQYPDEMADHLSRWRQTDNIWLRRTTLLFQLSYKAKTDETLLFELVQDNRTSKEFFIQKAIGWALREYSKTAPDGVKSFVERTELSALSKREALKWLEKQNGSG